MRRPTAARWTVRLAILATAVLAVALGAAPASAITHGDLDGDGHPYVGLMVAKDADGNPLWRCSGTLISSTRLPHRGPLARRRRPRRPRSGSAPTSPTPRRSTSRPTVTRTARPTCTPTTTPPTSPFATWEWSCSMPPSRWLSTARSRRSTRSTTWEKEDRDLHHGRLRRAADVPAGRGVEDREPAAADGRDPPSAAGELEHHRRLLAAALGQREHGWRVPRRLGQPQLQFGDSNVVGAVTSSSKSDLCKSSTRVFRMDRAWALDWVEGFLTTP